MAFKVHCREYFPETPDKLVYTHIANQGRSAGQGSKLKKMGVSAGWFDFVFLAHPSPWKTINLEAKVVDEHGHRRDYSDSQEHFDFMTQGMPVFKRKFYTVEEGHCTLIEAGVHPIKPCRLFKEPDYLTKQDKMKLAFDMHKP